MDRRTSDMLTPPVRALNDKVCWPHPGYRDRLWSVDDQLRDAVSIIGDISGDIKIFKPEMRARILAFLDRFTNSGGDEHG